MEEKILTLHPDPHKRGVRISKEKYDLVRTAIREVLRESGELTFTRLAQEVENRLNGKMDGSISWYTVSVKLDLEARHEIERTATRPHKVRLKE